MVIDRFEMVEIIAKAKKSIRIIGVVPLDINWPALISSFEERNSKGVAIDISILCESSNALFSKSLTSDSDINNESRKSFKEMEFVRDRATGELLDLIKERKLSSFLNVRVEIAHIYIPMHTVEVDSDIYVCEWLLSFPSGYTMVEQYEILKYKEYLDSFFNKKVGGKYSALKGQELLELYDHNRVPRGIYPRSSFYDTDYSQHVIWGLVFDRSGRMLIHRRSDNAKDNQSMWDKSVGGHVDYEIDVDSSRAMARELLEELFTNEDASKDETQAAINALTVTDQDIIYMGEWRPDRRKYYPIQEISRFKKEWAFFCIRKSQHVFSPRLMPNGSQRRLRVIADVYIFLAGPGLNENAIKDFENSEYKLLGLQDLKSAMDKAMRNELVPDFEPKSRRKPIPPKFSPDLVNIMTGELKDTLEEFAQYIKAYC